MKLRLPSRLRAALLSCICVVVTTLSSGAFLQPAQAAELYFNSTAHAASHITWADGTFFAYDEKPDQAAFAAGDDVVLMKPAVLTLGENVTAGVVSILDKADVTLTGAGNKLTATMIDIGTTGTLRLTDDALAAGVKISGKEDSLLIFDFNGGTAAYDAHLTGYKGKIEVNGCTWQLNPSESTAYSRVTLSGGAVLDLGAQSTLRADIVALGDNTLRVGSSGSDSMLLGEISGCGTLTKTGAGMLDIGPSDEYFSGTLVIQEGSVRWRGTKSHNEVQDQRNRLCFDTIVVNSGTTFEDGHIGRNVSDTTGIVLRGGKVQAYALKDIDGTFNTLTENTFKSLHVEGSGTLDFDFNGGRRFGVVTATAGSTLTVNNGSERSYTALDLIKDFDGTINGEAKTDNQQLIIGEVDEAAGMKLTINPKVTATDFTKSGDGELDMVETLKATRSVNILGGTTTARAAVTTNSLTVGDAVTKFTARNNVTATESVSIAAETEVRGDLTAGSVDTQAALSVTGGSLTVDGKTAFSGSANFGAATVLLKGELSSAKENSRINVTNAAADVTVQGATTATSLMMSGGQMQAAGVQLSGQMLLTGGTLTSSADVQAGNLLMTGGALAANNLSVRSLTLNNGALNVTQDVSVSRQLTMNYGGELNIGGSLHLADGMVLSYTSALNNTLQLTLSDLSSVNRLYVDVSQVSAADLRNGVNLGISFGAKDKLSIGSLANYTVENRAGQAFLVSSSKAARYNWDGGWGAAEDAKAPETLPTVNWTTVAEKPGLANSPYYDKGNVIAGLVTGGTVTGNAPHINQIFGGAYGTQPIDAAGGTIERNIWLAVSNGTYEIVGGGNFSLRSSLGTASGAAAAYDLKGDTHVQIESSATVGSVFGSNVNNIFNPTHTGDSYISVYSREVTGSVVGSGYMTRGQTGDTYVNIYAPLYMDEVSLIVDRTLSDMTEGYHPYEIDANAVIGGVLAGDAADMQGNTTLNIDFHNSGGTMVKHLVGGNFDQWLQAQTGNTLLNIQHVSGSILRGRVVGGHDYVGGFVDQTRVGSTDVRISDAANTSFRDTIAGAHYLNEGEGHYYQSLQGDLSLTVTNASNISISGDIMVSGHYAVTTKPVLFNAVSTQTHTGNTRFALSDIKGADVSSILVGGHYYSDNYCETLDPDHSQDTIPIQEHIGAVNMSISRSEGAVFGSNVVAGHYVTSDALPVANEEGEEEEVGATTLHTVQRQQGDVNLTIDSSRDNYAGQWLVGGHYADAETDGTTTMRHKDGDIHVTIGNGIFRTIVVLGDVHNEENDWDSDIEGGTFLTVTGGTFHSEVIGASFNAGDTGVAHVGSVNMDISNATFNAPIIGGYVAGGTTSVGDITLSFRNATVNAEIFGGTATRQGNISLALHGGSFKGNIYAAGMGALWTSSTTVAIDDDVQFGRGLRISGGFAGEGDNVVYGPKTLSFTSAGSSYANASGVTFTEFDTVNVAAADTTVTLRQNLQLMGQYVAKTGEGTLALYKDNEIDNVTVREGTLRLAGNSRGQGGTQIEHLQVDKNGTLDISAGNCGINGSLTLAQGSGLAVRANQAAAAITDLNWEGRVMMNVLDATPANMDEGYEIKLFSGLSAADISGLELEHIAGISGLAASAATYIDSDYANGAVLVLREDGTLVLSSKESIASYWLNGSGEWNHTDAKWYTQQAAEGTPLAYQNGSRTYFVGDGTPADVEIAEDVAPYSLTVRDGEFHFVSAADNTISLKSDLVVEHADATFDNEVNFGTYSNIAVDETSTLALNGNDDVTVYDVDNAGSLDVGSADMTVTHALRNSSVLSAGSLELLQGTQQGGIVKTGALKLGGDTTFDSVQATSIDVQTSLTVVSDLVTDSLTLAGKDGTTSSAPLVTAGSVDTNAAGTKLDIEMDNSVLRRKSLLTGGDYYLLRSNDIKCDFTLNGAELQEVQDGRYSYTFNVDAQGLKVSSAVDRVDYFVGMAESENGKAAAAMIDNLFAPGNTALANTSGDLASLVHSLNQLDGAHDSAAVEQLAAAAAGASIPGLGLAIGNDMERQLRAIRNRTTTMGVDQTAVGDSLPYFNAWVNAEGDYRSVSGDKTEAGYDMSSFGGTVGFDVDMTPHLTCGLALTAMHGKYNSEDIDKAEGNVTTEYLSVFGRYARHAWTHTFVASVGIAQADIDRTVSHAGGSYTTSGSTNGTAFGLMYEVGHVTALTNDGSVCLQPFANAAFVHASLSGYEEEGSDAALTVGDISYNAAIFGLGARLQGVGGENVYNRSSIYEVRALAKLHAGDRNAEADMNFAHGTPGTLRSAEIGVVGAEFGAGITIPVGGNSSSLFADVSVEFNSAYTQVNGTVGYRVNF